jgi:hypothetical protein
VSDELNRLWDEVAHVARGRLAVLEAAAHALELGRVDARRRCDAAAEESHKLVGSLDSYGITGGSALALEVARLLEVPEPQAEQVRAAVDRLRALVG